MISRAKMSLAEYTPQSGSLFRFEPFTSDNLQLSELKTGPEQAENEGKQASADTGLPSDAESGVSAINCYPTIALNCKGADHFLKSAFAPNSWRAYRKDLDHFYQWGGVLPATPEVIAAYLAAHAHTLAVATLKRRLATLAVAHKAAGYDNPVSHPLVRATLRGIARECGSAQQQAAPLMLDDLLKIVGSLGDTVRDHRDRALLLVGFAGAFRRSELVGLDIPDINFVREGLVIRLRRSKTDQAGRGRSVAIPLARGRHCPVKALEAWLGCVGASEGPIFRSVAKGGSIRFQRLSDRAVSGLIKEQVARIGLDPALYSGHSLRAGLATSAAQAGVSSWKIRAQTGHKSDAMLERYIRDGELFIDNAAGILL